jgi:hypothetical protein
MSAFVEAQRILEAKVYRISPISEKLLGDVNTASAHVTVNVVGVQRPTKNRSESTETSRVSESVGFYVPSYHASHGGNCCVQRTSPQIRT